MTEATSDRLALALIEAGAPPIMVEKAKEGYYDDYKSPIAIPLTQLIIDLRAASDACVGPGRIPVKARLLAIADQATQGKWDCTKEEADEWFRKEGRGEFFGEQQSGPAKD